MQSLNSLYFPETILPRHQRNTLLLLPNSLHFLQPIEKDDSVNDDLFMEKGICQVHTPSPLKKDRDRFLGLIREIQEQKSSNAEQFSSLTLAALSESQQRGDQNHRTIMTSLLDGRAIENTEDDDDQQEAKLWQARLVLTLAEILDKEEAELAENFSNIDETELNIFQELRGEMDAEAGIEEEQDDPFAALTRIRAKMNQQRPGTIKRRLQAWKTFYASGTVPEPFWFWMSSLEEAGDLLISDYEEASGRNAVPLLRLTLPDQMMMRDKDALKQLAAFHEEADKTRKEIIKKLQKIVQQSHLDLVDPVALLPDAGVLARDWNELVEYHFPEERFGRKKLDLQFLANISLDQVVRNDTESPSGKLSHSIVAICRES